MSNPVRHSRYRRRAARRIRWAHLDPRPLALDRTLDRLRDIVTAHDLPRWRVDTWGGDDGQTWASVGWESPWGPIAVDEPHGRAAVRRIHIRVKRILRAQDKALRQGRAPVPTRPAAILREGYAE